MYPKDKKTAALMSETIREVLSNPDVMDAIINSSDKKPPYWDMMPEKNGMTAIVIAQMLKAMAGDTSAFSALSKYGFGEKIQMDVSDFYRTDTIRINVVKNNNLLDEENTDGNYIEGTIEDEEGDEGMEGISSGDISSD